ncbi:MAG: DUF2817 domain-containing protein [Chitinophagaceae bacterium]|nr:DUF2817 domain-containing protein [Rubrivivax sp.]
MHVPTETAPNASDYFSERLDQAGARFRLAADAAQTAVRVHAHPKLGPQGEALATMVAHVNPASPTVLVVVSGTHGVEGLCGSAIQCALLEQLADRPPPRDLGLLLVHHINPWGAAWDRREDDANVDIFRNLLYRHSPFARNELYERYEEGINPRAWEGPERERADRIYRDFVDAHGVSAALGAIRRGQHQFPKGITFHGTEATWSRRVVEQIGRDHLADARRIDVLDIHTGYGRYGELLVIPTAPLGDSLQQIIEEWFPEQAYRWGQDAMIPRHPEGPYHLWQEQLTTPVLNNIGLEFGTYDLERCFDLFRANNCFHAYGDPLSPAARDVAKDYREMYCPASPAWRALVLERGLGFIRTYIDRLQGSK